MVTNTGQRCDSTVLVNGTVRTVLVKIPVKTHVKAQRHRINMLIRGTGHWSKVLVKGFGQRYWSKVLALGP